MLPVGFERAREHTPFRRRGGRLCHYYDLQSLEHRLVQSKGFSNLTLNAIARYRLRGYASSDDGANAPFAVASTRAYAEEGVSRFNTAATDGNEVGRST